MPTVPYRWRWAALAALLLAEAMNLLDATIVQVSAPVIHADLTGPSSDIQWLSAAYTLPFALFLIAGGRLGDLAGRKRLFRIGVTSFVIASLACALAPSSLTLIGVRAVQGLAAALVIPQTFGLIRAMFDRHERPKALGTIGPVMGLAAVLGPALGGVLAYADLLGVGWRAVFLVNVPLGLVVLLVAPLLVEDRAPHRPRLDVVGNVLVVVGAGLILYPLIEGWSWGLAGSGLAVLLVFGLHQRRQSRRGDTALIEAGLFRTGAFSVALVGALLFFAATTGLVLVVGLDLQLARQLDVRTAGLTLLPWAAGMAVASWLAASWILARVGPRLMVGALLVLLAGTLAATAVYATGPAGDYPWLLLPSLAAAGFGMGLFTVPFFGEVLGRIQPRETGSATGLLNAAQELGGTVGVALLGGVYLRSATGGAEHAFLLAAVLIVLTTVSAVALSGVGSRPTVELVGARKSPAAAGR
jgi:EmrB/QacA subfamily drug resistance transporter